MENQLLYELYESILKLSSAEDQETLQSLLDHPLVAVVQLKR